MARRSLSASAATLLLVAALLCAGAQAAPRRLMGSDLTVVPVRRLLENDGCPGIGTDDFGTTRKFATCEADGKLVSALATADADGNLLTLSMGCSNGNATVPAEGELFAACPVNATVIEVSRLPTEKPRAGRFFFLRRKPLDFGFAFRRYAGRGMQFKCTRVI